MTMSDKQYIVYMDGIHDDTEATQAALDGKEVRFPDGRIWSLEAAAITPTTKGEDG